MAQFEHIAIIGIGLIGGSFALALRESGFDGQITGWDRSENLAFAQKSAIIDGPEESFNRGEICQADLVYLAMPIGAIIDFLREHCHQFKAGALITDCGSTKRAICAAAAGLPENIDFIGGHPMAGSEKRGVEAARADLFQNANYFLVPRAGMEQARLLQFELLLREMGARPARISAPEHDEIVAMVSHLPQLTSTAMVVALANYWEGRQARGWQFGGAGFRDMSRLAGSSWTVWQDICASNRDWLTLALDELIKQLGAMRAAMVDDQMKELAEAFARASYALDNARKSDDF
jgi:prephenate dehydrogenase